MKDTQKKPVYGERKGYRNMRYPLTYQQRAFAAKHHRLVYKFLSEKCFPVDEYYDVVIFGYLRAVRRYFTEPKLRKYRFSTIAWSCMRADFVNYLKKAKHTVELTDTVQSQQTAWQYMELKLMLYELSKRLPVRQMQIVILRVYGYSVSEIADAQGLSAKQVRRILRDVYRIIREICNEEV